MLDLPEGSTLPVIAFHGVGGVGKTMLLDRLGRELDGLKPRSPMRGLTSTISSRRRQPRERSFSDSAPTWNSSSS
jgi:hypothetical protein